ncbi:MAG: HNH endonuclease [Planctomycetes bacterium]|nr:HNH endonuclease [Planctomycetota bacterium]
MSEYVPAELRRVVRERAKQRCEYCLIHENESFLPHEPDHIIAIKHQGRTTESNLAWTCFTCNRAKGSDLASVDPATGEVVRLFNPRSDTWEDHLEVNEDGFLNAKSAIGRVTVALLKLNRQELLAIRTLFSKTRRKPR